MPQLSYLGSTLPEGETVTCHISINDGIEDGLDGEVSARINNEPTVAPAMSQNPVSTNDILTYLPNGFDLDGDNLTSVAVQRNSEPGGPGVNL